MTQSAPLSLRRTALGLIGGLALLSSQAWAATPVSDEAVARGFVEAAKAQDHKAVLALLDPAVQIDTPQSSETQQGRAFVIGYFDGLFDGRHTYQLDSTTVSQTGDVRFTAHALDSRDRYGLDVQVRGQRVVRLKLSVTPAPDAS